MSNPVAKIVDRHLKIWNTRHAAERITGIPSTYAEDVVIGEPGQRGFQVLRALNLRLKRYRRRCREWTSRSPARSRQRGHVYVHLGARGERRQPRRQGRDVITVKHERIISRYVFFDT